MAIFDFLESWSNRKRRHSALGYLSPNDFERAAAQAATPPVGNGDRHDRTDLKALRIGEPEVPNYPPGGTLSPDSGEDFTSTGSRHLSAGGESPQPSTGSG